MNVQEEDPNFCDVLLCFLAIEYYGYFVPCEKASKQK